MKALNPNTGNLETVYVKAIDSLPVGTTVEYTGQASDIPAGWEAVSGQNKITKTSETRPLTRSVVNEYSESTENAYSCDYQNKAFGGIILWTNPAPNSGFAGQDITLPNEDYDYYKIITRVGGNDPNMLTTFVYKNLTAVATYPFYYNGTLYVRSRLYSHTQTSSSNKITVANGENTGSPNNNVCMPQLIIGYKKATTDTA